MSERAKRLRAMVDELVDAARRDAFIDGFAAGVAWGSRPNNSEAPQDAARRLAEKYEPTRWRDAAIQARNDLRAIEAAFRDAESPEQCPIGPKHPELGSLLREAVGVIDALAARHPTSTPEATDG